MIAMLIFSSRQRRSQFEENARFRSAGVLQHCSTLLPFGGLSSLYTLKLQPSQLSQLSSSRAIYLSAALPYMALYGLMVHDHNSLPRHLLTFLNTGVFSTSFPHQGTFTKLKPL